MVLSSHGAAPSAVGYQHQTWWALVELLRSGATQPDAAITLELHDDVAWEQGGSPTQLLQVKHHQNAHRALTDTSADVWRTLMAWMDVAAPGDAAGPKLLLISTQTAGAGTAVAALRPETLDEQLALEVIETVARDATSEQTKKARERFLALTPSDRRVLISRIRVIDGSPHIDEIPALVRACLHWTLPIGHEDLFLALLWQWWDEQALAMLQGKIRSVDVGVAQMAIADIRDRFTSEGLPTLVELVDVDVDRVTAEYRTHIFVQQMQWVVYPPRNLQKAIVDYYRAYTQTVRWLDDDLIGVAELAKFEAELIDEWEREFDWMLDTLGGDASDVIRQQAGRQMLRQLLSQTGITVRARYNEPFFVRGQRHILADAGRVGWHPDFESRIQQLLQVSV